MPGLLNFEAWGTVCQGRGLVGSSERVEVTHGVAARCNDTRPMLQRSKKNEKRKKENNNEKRKKEKKRIREKEKDKNIKRLKD